MYLISLDAVQVAYSLCISKLIRVFCFRVIAFIIIITVMEVIIEIYCVVIIFFAQEVSFRKLMHFRPFWIQIQLS